MKKISLALCASFFCAGQLFATASQQELETLRLELQQLQTKMEQYQEEQNAFNKKNKGILELNSSETVLSIGGRVQINGGFDAPSGAFFPGRMPLDAENKKNNFGMHARDSRLWVKTRTPTKYGPMLTTIEIDFWGANGSNVSNNNHSVRFRHAYVEFAGFGFGQTNSAFNSIVAIETITYPMDDTFVRQPAVRYTHNGENISYDISLEDANATLFDKEDRKVATPANTNMVPDLILRARYYQPWGEVGLAYLSRLVKQEGIVADTKDTKYAWGTNLSGRIETFGLDDIRFNAHYGVGTGRYIGYNAFGAGAINQTTGEIDLTTAYGGHLGYRHWWNNSLRSTFALSYLASDTKDENKENFGFLTKETRAFQVNLFWIPIRSILTGVEFARGKREVYNGQSGMMSHTNLIFRYDF